MRGFKYQEWGQWAALCKQYLDKEHVESSSNSHQRYLSQGENIMHWDGDSQKVGLTCEARFKAFGVSESQIAVAGPASRAGALMRPVECKPHRKAFARARVDQTLRSRGRDATGHQQLGFARGSHGRVTHARAAAHAEGRRGPPCTPGARRAPPDRPARPGAGARLRARSVVGASPPRRGARACASLCAAPATAPGACVRPVAAPCGTRGAAQDRVGAHAGRRGGMEPLGGTRSAGWVVDWSAASAPAGAGYPQVAPHELSLTKGSAPGVTARRSGKPRANDKSGPRGETACP